MWKYRGMFFGRDFPPAGSRRLRIRLCGDAFHCFFLCGLKRKSLHISICKDFTLFAASFSRPWGWKMGLEPTTFGTTIRRSNQLSYIHRVDTHSSYRDANVICFFGPCKIFGLKIFGKTHRVTKWQSPLLVCHAKPAKKRLAHLLMDTGVRKQLKKHI